MTAFDFVFSLFVLLLGFSLVEVLGGFARALNSQPRRPLGWLTPMLALFVMLDLTGFWSIAWQARDVIPPTYAALVVGLAITGLYYVAASTVFPGAGSHEADLDAHYFRVKRQVFSIVLACQLLAHASRFAIMGSASFANWATADWVLFPVFIASLIFGLFARGRIANLGLLSLLILLYLLDAVASPS